jgi:hypothetical protein
MQQEITPFFKAQEIFLMFFEQIPDYVDRVTAEVIAKENALNSVRLMLDELNPRCWGSEIEKAITRYNYYTEVEDQLQLL